MLIQKKEDPMARNENVELDEILKKLEEAEKEFSEKYTKAELTKMINTKEIEEAAKH